MIRYTLFRRLMNEHHYCVCCENRINYSVIALFFIRQMNFADYTNLFVYKEAYRTDYVYDANGAGTARCPGGAFAAGESKAEAQ